MPYLGNELATQFQAFVTQTITGDGSTGYTLDRAVANGKELLVYINNVKQEEGSGKSYTASGTTITFSDAVASTDSCYVVFLGSAIQTITAPDSSIVSGQIANATLVLPNKLDMNGNELILDADADSSITADTDDQIDFRAGGTDVMAMSTTGLTITNAANTTQLTLKSTDADGSSGPLLDLTRDSGSPADGDVTGIIRFRADNDAGEVTTTGQIVSLLNDASDGTEDGEIKIETTIAGSAQPRIDIIPSETVFNEGSVDVDFRVESNGNANMLVVDAGNDRVSIGEASPTALLHVSSADSGVTASADSDELLVEGSGNSGMTIGSGASSTGSIRFADSGTDNRGFILYNHSDDTLAFGTAATEAFRVNSAQDMTIGNSDPSDDTPNIGFQFDDGGGTSSFMNIGHTSSSGTNDGYIRFCRGGSVIGQIRQDGNTNVSYLTSSDYRLKENIVTDWDATSRLKQLKPSRFNFKEDKGKTVDGFIAHEVSSIVPEAIGGEKDAMTKEVLYVKQDEIPEGKKVGDVKKPSKIDPQGIDQSKLVPLLTKALQEAISEIDTLKAKVTALESK